MDVVEGRHLDEANVDLSWVGSPPALLKNLLPHIAAPSLTDSHEVLSRACWKVHHGPHRACVLILSHYSR